MKRLFLALAASLVLASCAPTFESIQADINSVAAQMPEAVRAKDIDRWQSLTNRLTELAQQVTDSNLSVTEKAELNRMFLSIMMDSRNRF